MTIPSILLNPVRFAKEMVSLNGALRIGNQKTLGDYTLNYGIDDRKMWSDTAGSGSVSAVTNISSARLQVTSASGDRATLRSHHYHRYQAGKPQVCEVTGFADSAPASNQVMRWGVGDDNNGLFFEYDSTGVSVVVRSNTSGSPTNLVKVASASWNRSTTVPTLEYGNVFGIRYKWLGYGPVQFLINDKIVHQEDNFNVRAAPFMRTGNLPVFAEIENTGASTGNSFYFSCAQVYSEGGSKPILKMFSERASATISTVVPLISIRNLASFNGEDNRVVTLPTSVSASTTAKDASFLVVLNPTLTSPSWGSVASSSSMEVDTSASGYSGGSVLAELLVSSPGSDHIDLTDIFDLNKEFMRLAADGTTRDVLSIVADNIIGGSTDVSASLSWGEQQ